MPSVDKKNGGLSPTPANTDKGFLLRFGAFTLDLNRHGLFMGSTRIHLTSKPFETLVVLMEHRGTTVQKQQLMDAVWKDSFVTEDSLVKAIREVRRALDDEKGNPKFIQTVPGEGYRFIAEVTSVNEQIGQASVPADVNAKQEEGLSAPTVVTPPIHETRRRFSATAAGVLVLIGIIGVVALWQPRPKTGSTTQSYIGTISAPYTSLSLSPDGNFIAFIADLQGIPQIWIRSLAGGEPLPVTSGNSPASHPSWSPQSNQIVFSRGIDSPSIWSVPPLGGQSPTLLIEEGRNPRLSLQGDRMVFEKRNEIWTAGGDGTHQQKVKGIPVVDLLIVDREPSFSPDGSRIAFFQPEDGPMGDIWVIPSIGGQAKQLTFDNHYGGGLVWTPDGTHIIFTSQRGGSKTLWKIAASGGNPEPVLKSPGEDSNPEISRDGMRLFYVRTRNQWELILRDALSGKSIELRKTITDMFYPSFSPDGDRIAFFATAEGGDIQLFTIRTSGTELTQVTRTQGERNVFPTWSTDGSALYFYQLRPDLSYRRISSAGGTSSEVFSGWRWRTHYGAQVDASGNRIVYSRVSNGITVATVFRDIQTGTESVLARTLDSPRWSKDAKSLVGVDTSGGKEFGDVVICSVATAACRKVAVDGASPIWSQDDSRIYFERWRSADKRDVWSVSAEGQDEKRITERVYNPMGPFYDVSRLGHLTYVRFIQGQKELWMTEVPTP